MTSDEPYWHVTRANNTRNTHSLLGKKLGLGVRYQLSLGNNGFGPENHPLPRENMVFWVFFWTAAKNLFCNDCVGLCHIIYIYIYIYTDIVIYIYSYIPDMV